MAEGDAKKLMFAMSCLMTLNRLKTMVSVLFCFVFLFYFVKQTSSTANDYYYKLQRTLTTGLKGPLNSQKPSGSHMMRTPVVTDESTKDERDDLTDQF